MPAEAGRFFLVRYDVAGGVIYHERLFTAVADDGAALRSVVLTPDGDH